MSARNPIIGDLESAFQSENQIDIRFRNFYAAILQTAIEDLRRYKNLDPIYRANSTGSFLANYQKTVAWINDETPTSRVQLVEILEILGINRRIFLLALRDQGLIP